MRRIALLRNPGARAAGDGPDLAAELRGHGAAVEELGEITPEALAAGGFDRLVAAGGDGTIGPAARDAGAAGIPFALVPAGTANDFARAFGLPRDPVAACRVAATGEETRRLDLGMLGSRPFVNVASAGLPPAAARRARGLKRLLGPLAYVVGAARAGANEEPLPCRVTCDGADLFVGRAWQVTVAVSGAFGAGSSIAAADAGDGLLDVAVIPAGPRRRLAVYARALRTGRVAERAEVRHVRAAEVALSLPDGAELNVDGEVVPQGNAQFAVAPGAFELVVG